MENLESHGVLEFHFPGLEEIYAKVMKFKYGSWKVVENDVY